MLLKSDNELLKSIGLTSDISTEDKVQFLVAQIEGIRQSMWRSRVDAILNRNISTADDKERAAVLSKIAEHEQDVKRYAEALGLLEGIKAELEA
jgi:hypothetical protein